MERHDDADIEPTFATTRRGAIAGLGAFATGQPQPQTARVGSAGQTGADQVFFMQEGRYARPRSVEERLRDEITPLDFGAPCDGVRDDRPAIQAAADLAMRAGKPLSLRPRGGGHWRIGGTLDFSYQPSPSAANFAMPSVIDGWNALIRPLDGYSPKVMIRCRNTTNSLFRNLRIDGAGRADLLLDTSWDRPGPPPARNVVYSQLELRGAAGAISWKAHRENDSPIVSCVVAGPVGRAHIGIDLMADGGHVRLISPEIFNAVVRVSCQSLTIHDGVISGVRVVGADDNCIVFSGNGYSYPSAEGINIEIAEGARIAAFRASGRFENAHPGGAIVDGRGKLCGGMDFDGAYFLQPGTRRAVRLVGDGVRSIADGYRQTIRIRGGQISGIDYRDTDAVRVSLDGTFINGVLIGRRLLGAHNWIEENGEELSHVHQTAAYGPAATVRSAVVRGQPAGRSALVSLPGLPIAGTLAVRCTNETGPTALFGYAKGRGNSIGAVREIAASAGQGGGRIDLRIVPGDKTVFAISHDQAGMTTDYIVAFCGVA